MENLTLFKSSGRFMIQTTLSFPKIMLSMAVVIFVSVFLEVLFVNTVAAIDPKSIYFSEEINVSKNNGTSELPQITATKDSFYVFWKDDVNGGINNYFKEGRKESSTTNIEFGSSKRILNSGNVSNPRLTVGDTIFSSIWISNSINSSVIKFYPLGFFDDPIDAIQVTKSSRNTKIPSVSITGDDAAIYLVWENKIISASDIFFKRVSYVTDG